MITLTQRAGRQVESLQKKREDPSQRLRVFVDPGGCSGFEYKMTFGVPQKADVKVESQGVTFFVERSSADYLRGVEIDFDDGLSGKGFEINNPNAQATCGCGKSFS